MTGNQQPPPPSQIDLDNLLTNSKYTLANLENDAERNARLEKEKWAARHANWQWWAEKVFKEYIVYLFAIATVATISWWALATINSTTAQADDKKYAQTIVASVLTGVLGYLVGKGTTSPPTKS